MSNTGHFKTHDAAVHAFKAVPEIADYVNRVVLNQVLVNNGYKGGHVPDSEAVVFAQKIEKAMNHILEPEKFGKSPDVLLGMVNEAHALKMQKRDYRDISTRPAQIIPTQVPEEMQTVFGFGGGSEKPGFFETAANTVRKMGLGKFAATAAMAGMLLAPDEMAAQEKKGRSNQAAAQDKNIGKGTISEDQIADFKTIAALQNQIDKDFAKMRKEFLVESRKAYNVDDNKLIALINNAGNVLGGGSGGSWVQNANTTYKDTREVIRRDFPALLGLFDATTAGHLKNLERLEKLDPDVRKDIDRQATLADLAVQDRQARINAKDQALKERQQLLKDIENAKTPQEKLELYKILNERDKNKQPEEPEVNQDRNQRQERDAQPLTGAAADACFGDYNKALRPSPTNKKADSLQAILDTLPELSASCAATVKKYFLNNADQFGHRHTPAELNKPSRGGGQNR